MPRDPSPRVEPIGMRLIDSTPPATTTSACPLTTVAAAKATDCWEEPHCRSIVVPGTVSGQPAESTALRAMLKVCSPTWLTQPQNTSSTTAGSIPVRSTIASSTAAERSTGCTPDRPPLRLPTGVRTAAQMTASRMDLLLVDDGPRDRRRTGVPCGDGKRCRAALIGLLESSGAVQWSPRVGETVALGAI